jgi:hypothetical protein
VAKLNRMTSYLRGGFLHARAVFVRHASLSRVAPVILLTAASVVSAAPSRELSETTLIRIAPPSAPQLSIAVSPRKLELKWSRTPGAFHYRVYQKRLGESEYTQIGRALPAWTSHKAIPLSAHLHSWDHTTYLVAACNVIGCTRSTPIGTAGQSARAIEVITSDYELHEPTGAPRNQTFGVQTALSGDGKTLAVADIWYYGGSEWPWYGSGAVYVYARVDTGWTLQAKLEPPAARGYDFFGSDLALNADGSTLAIGAQYEGYDAPSQDAGPGTVYVFDRHNGVWAQQGLLRATNPQDAASFGRNVEINNAGTLIAVAAPYEHTSLAAAAVPEAGAVYVFERSGETWASQAALHAPNPEQYDHFGAGIRLSDRGGTLAVLAGEQNYSTEDPDLGGWPNRNNTVYVFGFAEAEWELQAEIEGSPDDLMLGGVGYATEGQAEAFDLSADGRTLAIASPYALAPDNGVGVIRFYERNNGAWTPSTVTLTPSLADRRVFGLRLSLSGDGRTLAAWADRDDGVYGEPHVFVFSKNAGRWTETSDLLSPLYPDYTSFGDALSLSSTGKRLAIGSRSYTSGEAYWGAVLIY